MAGMNNDRERHVGTVEKRQSACNRVIRERTKQMLRSGDVEPLRSRLLTSSMLAIPASRCLSGTP
jgi:hypothetical protein